MCLGVRPASAERAAEIATDANGNVHPHTGGMSVYSSLRVMPARMVPKRLQPVIPFAAGSNNLNVWRMGDGPFVACEINRHLRLVIDPEDIHHGFVEPSAIMPFEDYVRALAETQALWVVSED